MTVNEGVATMRLASELDEEITTFRTSNSGIEDCFFRIGRIVGPKEGNLVMRALQSIKKNYVTSLMSKGYF